MTNTIIKYHPRLFIYRPCWIFSFSGAIYFYLHFMFYLMHSMRFQKRQTVFMETHWFQLFWIYRELFFEYCWMLTHCCVLNIPLCPWGLCLDSLFLCRNKTDQQFLKIFVFEENVPHLPFHSLMCFCLLKISTLIF